MTSIRPVVLLLVLAAVAAGAVPAVAQDVVTVGSLTTSASTVDVPVYIRDSAGTPLGVDRPAGSHIQAYSIKVNYAPAAAVQSVTFSRAGITASLTPTFETAPSSSGSISLLDTFSETASPIPFTSNAALPGNLVAHLVFTLSSSAAPGSAISLTLDSSLTQLTDEGGTAATKETAANGSLSLVNGAINIPQPSLVLTPNGLQITTGSSASMTVTSSVTLTTDTQVALASSAPAVARVPSSVTIPAGVRSGSFTVTPVAQGSSIITATLPQSLGGATAQATVVIEAPPPCVAPPVPQPSAPSTAVAGAQYSVSWPEVNGASEYLVDEATTPDFAASSTTAVATTSASFSHTTAATTYFYRVRAHTKTSTCDQTSASSTTVSVLITAGPTITRYVAVVGSVPGSQGSNFKTSVQLFNPKDTAISGKIVFHSQGVSGSAGDPSIAYVLPPGSTIAYADLLPAMGVATGLGSADLVVDATSPLPIVVVRVFNDGGVARTTGLTEGLLSTADALAAGDSAALLAPADVQAFRFNIGIRTLADGATLSGTVRDKNGVVVKTVSRTFGPTFFVQQSSAVFLDGYALTGGETVTIAVTAGSAIVYGSTTDNTTQDPSVQFGVRIE